MRIITCPLLLFWSIIGCLGETLNSASISFKKGPNGDYECTVVNHGDGLILSDPGKCEYFLVIEDLVGSSVFKMSSKVWSGKTNMHWKHLVVLLRNRESSPRVNSFTFILTREEVKHDSEKNIDDIKLLGVQLFCCKYEDFLRDGIEAMKLFEIPGVPVKENSPPVIRAGGED
jgi:hypothetical protein